MRLLVLGGTEFLGRAVAEEALSRGAEVTILNRGRHEPPPGVTALRGDRTAPDGLAALTGGEWDAVVDTWSGAPFAVRDATRLLAGRAEGYAYISSRSVYTYPPAPYLAEDGPVVDGSPGDGEDGGEVDYARAKRGGELAAEAVFGDRALLVRAGLIIGPRENTGRLPWWLGRIARGGVVPAPGPRDLDLQYVDARDLAAWTLDALARGLGGPYNAVGPPASTTMGEILEICARVTGAGAELRWIPPETVLARGVAPWTDLPMWLPPGDEHAGLFRGDVSRAIAAGLRLRPLEDTVADTWAHMRADGDPPRRKVGLTDEQEAALLAAAPGDQAC
ncbi:reductase [Sphaerisporangium album]|uniref:Reductase n=1 Tax=Sphaerisporangium album TaxID=509200 RepID=A0A367F9F8_9ACTN|nr:NAD-dependent epimerase/dehydratase family protein [Sphaerisporangium album]RCG26210.1 reductase [Sphaerisporangium album]